jgi:hypothetical protein
MTKKYVIAIIALLLAVSLSGILKSTASEQEAAGKADAPCGRE